jgi:hypothetical protein
MPEGVSLFSTAYGIANQAAAAANGGAFGRRLTGRAGMAIRAKMGRLSLHRVSG